MFSSLFFSNMIDVGAMDTHNLEPQECQDRIQLYKQRLLQQWSNIPHHQNKPTGFQSSLSSSLSIFCKGIDFINFFYTFFVGFLKDIPNTEVCPGKMTMNDDLVQVIDCLFIFLLLFYY